MQWHSSWRRVVWGRAIALVLACAIALAGCGASPGDRGDGRIHVTLWHGVNPPTNRTVLQTLVDAFNRSQAEVFVEAVYAGQADGQIPKILAAVVGNAPPDLLWYDATLTGRLVELGAIRPLDDLLARSPRRDEIDPALLPAMHWRGQTWSVPFATNNLGIFYRPSLFAKAGIAAPPTTWEELRQAAARLTADDNGDGVPDRYGLLLPLGKGEFTVFSWLPFLWSAGGEVMQGDRPQLATPQAEAALTLWQELVRSGSALLSQPERGYEEQWFTSGKVAMQITGSWTLRYMQEKGIDFAVMPIPCDRLPATAIGGEHLFLFRTTSDREAAAWKFMEYVLSEPFQTAWAMQTGYLPVNTRSRNSAAYREFLTTVPAVQTFLERMAVGRTRPLTPNYPRISENLGRAIEAVLLQKATPAAALQRAQQTLDLALP